MPPKKRTVSTSSLSTTTTTTTTTSNKDDSSSDSEDTKEARRSKAKWFWRGDSSKQLLDRWAPFDKDVNLRLEKAFLYNKKNKAKKVKEVKVDSERYVDMEKLYQRRYDDRKKKRPVKRSSSGDSDEDTDKEEEEKIKKILAKEKRKPRVSKKKDSSSESESASDDDDDYVKWMWAGDSGGGPEKGGGHQDIWVEYDKKMCKKLEKAFSTATEKEVKVDKERFIDLQNMLQRRYDDPSKRRSVKRIPPKKPKKVTKAKVSPTKPSKKKADDKKRKPDSDTESDSDDQKTKKAKGDAKPDATASSATAADLLKLPKTWTAQLSMDYCELEVDKSTQEFIDLKTKFINTIAPYHKNNNSIHRVPFTNFEVLKLVRIQNPMLWLRYRTRKEKIAADCGGNIPPAPNVLTGPSTDPSTNEFHLFHGLNISVIPGITRFGFDPRFCSLAGMFGAGLYFAEDSSKSNQYCHSGECTCSGPNVTTACRCKPTDEACMLICRVTLGDVLVEQAYRGNAPGQYWCNKRTEPVKPDGKSIWNSVLGESRKHYAGAALQLREYIVYESSQVYPEYILTFKRLK